MPFLFAFGCDGSPKVPEPPKQTFGIVKPDAERCDRIKREWQRFQEAYALTASEASLHPITCMPQSLGAASGQIQIVASPSQQEPLAETMRFAVKSFIDRWRELIGASPDIVSLAQAEESADGYRFRYAQANYPFPVVGGFGDLTILITREGRLTQIEDRFIPLVEMPLRPVIERLDAAKGLVGRTFRYKDIAGREQRVEITSIEEVKVMRLVTLPIAKDNALEIHLAWEIQAGKSLSWTVYIDAITGAELKAEQNFQT
jgi:hypothetical protein